MAEIRVAKRYAMGLMKSAEELKQVDVVSNDLQFLESIYRQSKDFQLFLHSPVIQNEKKKKILATMFSKKIGEVSLKFLLLLTAKGRENVFPEIIRQFFALRDEKLGIVNIDVTAAVRFSKTQEKNLISQLEEYTKKKVRLLFKLDKRIQGGFIVKVGDTILDGSLRRQLEHLREKFLEGAFAFS